MTNSGEQTLDIKIQLNVTSYKTDLHSVISFIYPVIIIFVMVSGKDIPSCF